MKQHNKIEIAFTIAIIAALILIIFGDILIYKSDLPDWLKFAWLVRR